MVFEGGVCGCLFVEYATCACLCLSLFRHVFLFVDLVKILVGCHGEQFMYQKFMVDEMVLFIFWRVVNLLTPL